MEIGFAILNWLGFRFNGELGVSGPSGSITVIK
jgi:hypothetical protein